MPDSVECFTYFKEVKDMFKNKKIISFQRLPEALDTSRDNKISSTLFCTSDYF